MAYTKFYKYQATGNDFILIDNRSPTVNFSLNTIWKICDRRFGVGSDGLILIQDHPDYDFEMVFYNPDGSQSLCGNGSRCAVNFARFLGIIDTSANFLAFDGGHKAKILKNNEVRLKMCDVQNVRSLADGMFVDTGSPHLIRYVTSNKNYNVYEEGRQIRNNPDFKKNGVNVNFVELINDQEIFVRTYERGVEHETLSCGTGVTAAAIAASAKNIKVPVKVNTKGGCLQVDFIRKEENNFTDVYLTGPAVHVFEGTIELDN